jgi:hypothetical protein
LNGILRVEKELFLTVIQADRKPTLFSLVISGRRYGSQRIFSYFSEFSWHEHMQSSVSPCIELELAMKVNTAIV